MVPLKKLMPPRLALMALRMMVAELAPRSTLLMFCAALAPWHMAQFAA